jgi:hypothetical protein
MSLPQLNSEPKFRIKIPSTGKETRFRPFLVKEEKVLLLAMESKDERQILDAVGDTIVACLEEPIDKGKLTAFDIEFLFTKIRAKSVGEVVHVGVECNSCKETNEIDINVDDITLPVNNTNKKIQITQDYTLEMRWPTLDGIMSMPTESTTENMLSMLRIAMVALHTPEARMDLSEYTNEEIESFIESMDTNQFAKIREFMDNMPSLKHKVMFDCIKCGHHNDRLLEGMQSFF